MPTPESIGRFEILREIGRGAMGVVYEARDPDLGRTVAVKVIQSVAETEELAGFEERFLDEAKIAAALQHPGIVVVHEVGRDSDTNALFIALELLRGETLAELSRAGKVEWRRVMRIVAQVARALHYAHTQGVVHRDIKPANVIVLPTGEAKVTDFGIARFEAVRGRLTSTGQFIGTPLYTAPEQARVEDVDGRADVFSLASVAYTLLTGQAAFAAPTVPGIVHRVVYEDPEAPSTMVRGLPADVEHVLARALAKDPAMRYATAEAFAEDAEDLLAGAPPRHLLGEELVVVDDDPAARHTMHSPGFAHAASAAPAGGVLPEEANDTRTSLPPVKRPPVKRRGLRVPVVVSALAVVLLIALFLSAPRKPGPAQGPAAPPKTAAPVAVAASPPAARESVAPARLRIDFDHPLRRGRLKVFVDDKLTLDERLTGQQKKAALVFKVHEGSFREELDVAPGLHEVRIEVTWDDQKKLAGIVGNFRGGATRRLDASLGRMRRELTLEWH